MRAKFCAGVAAALLMSVSQVSAASNDFIVNGAGVEAPDELPWQVRIFWDDTDPYGLCGGSIIDQQWVLTAAHCVTDFVRAGSDIEDADLDHGDFGFEPSVPEIGYGSHKLSELERVPVEAVFMHPYYGRSGMSADVALMKLAEPVPAGLVVPYRTDLEPVSAETEATVSGWGALVDPDFDPSLLILFNAMDTTAMRNALANEDIQVPETLRRADIKVLSFENCAGMYERIGDPRLRISEGELCAGLPGSGRDSCYGDSGGPLVARKEDGSFELFGIVSWGYQCGHPFFPGVYARTGFYSDWIEATMQAN